MTLLDPPAAAARWQWAIDRIVEDLVEWGCPVDTATVRARQLLGHALDAGYALPVALQPHRTGPAVDPTVARQRIAAIRADLDARRTARAAADVPLGDPRPGSPVGEEPRNCPSASEGVASTPLRWHYGPTDTAPDPGRMWCYDCGHEVYVFREGYVCTGCKRSEDLP